MTDGRVVVLAAPGATTNIVHHALERAVPEVITIIEDPVSRLRLVRRRVARLGYVAVAGQLAFMIGLVPVLSALARRRVKEIIEEAGFDDRPVPNAHRVRSVNDSATQELLRWLDPAVVVVNGTRIIGADTLGCISAPFVNMHAGITPCYRGVHGGYWALVDGRPDLVGTTVHLVDRGIDTGEPLAQVTFNVGSQDSFATYPYLHVAAGLPFLVACVEALLDGRPIARRVVATPNSESKLRYHPTLWEYLSARIRTGAH